jgi:hypothetical protein
VEVVIPGRGRCPNEPFGVLGADLDSMRVSEERGLTIAWSACSSVTRLTSGKSLEYKFVRDCSSFPFVYLAFGVVMARGVDKDGVARDSVRIATGDAEGSTYEGKFVPDVGVPGIPWRCAGLTSLSFLGFLALPLVGCRNEGVTGKKV